MKKKLLLHFPASGAAEDIPPEPADPPVSRLNREMPVEVMRDFDTVVLFGRLTEADPIRLKIERMRDGTCIPILDEGSSVLVRGYDAQLAPVILLAMVIHSSGFGCTLESLGEVHYQTDRKLVRNPLCPPGSAQILDGSLPEQPQPCQLLNISTGGACIVSDQVYAVRQPLRIRIGTAEDCAAYPCQVVRSTPRRGGFFEYGLRFAHLGRTLRGRLAWEIHGIQEETRKSLTHDD